LKTKSLDGIAPVLLRDFIKALEEGGCTCGRKCKKGPYRVRYDGREYLSCNNPPHKAAGFNIPVGNAENRKIVRKWVEAELGV
jgi:hypothetical protein